MRIVEGLNNLADNLLPVAEDDASSNRALSFAWMTGAGFIGGETLDWVERGSHLADPVTAVGVVATALTTGASVFLWSRARVAEELEEQ